MTISLNARIDEQVVHVQAAADLLLASTAGAGRYVSLKNFRKMLIHIDVANGTSVTGGVIVLQQAQAIAGTGQKALAFTRMLANLDTGASQTMVETAVTNNTFTTDTTNSKNLKYIIEIDSEQLDVANGFDCVRCVGTLNAATASRGFTMNYMLFGARYIGANPMVD